MRSDRAIPRLTREALRSAYTLLAAGQAAPALNAYLAIHTDAQRSGDRNVAGMALVSAATCEMVLFRYQSALRKLYRARDDARAGGDCANLVTAEVNISSVQTAMGDYDGAMSSAQRALQLRRCLPGANNRAQILLHLGWLYSLQSQPEKAVQYSTMALEEIADGEVLRPRLRPGDASEPEPDGAFELRFVRKLSAAALAQIGSERIAIHDLAGAEDALSRAYRLRLLSRDPKLYISRYDLAKLALARGELPAARALIDTAISTSAGGSLPQYFLYHLRGRIREASGNLQGAVEDFRTSVQLASHWRGQILPADVFRTSTDARLQDVYNSFIEAAIRLAARDKKPELELEAWSVAEANRAASLRETLLASGDWRNKLDPGYWEILARLRRAESRSVSGQTDRSTYEGDELRQKLTELETRAGLASPARFDKFIENISPRITLTSLQTVLGNSRTLMSFHLGETGSYRWTVTSGSIEVSPLPPEGVVHQAVANFRGAVETGKADAAVAGRRLYDILFAGLRPDVPNHWLLALEDSLFKIPLAALIAGGTADKPQYLIERHTLEVVPGAWAVGSPQFVDGPFLGVGDPVYNRADARYARRSAGPFLGGWNWLKSLCTAAGTVELPRLPGSGREVEACARQWNGASQVLTGAEASRPMLVEALSRRPAAIHIATHFVSRPQTPYETLIALTRARLPDSGESSAEVIELLTASDVATLPVPGSLVVLSGCNSAAGATLPGAGLLGLTRSFLAAGASAVIASHWPTRDDSGELFAAFYRHLRERPETFASAPEALRAAQIDMLRSKSWRSRPDYWAAFQFISRSNPKP